MLQGGHPPEDNSGIFFGSPILHSKERDLRRNHSYQNPDLRFLDSEAIHFYCLKPCSLWCFVKADLGNTQNAKEGLLVGRGREGSNQGSFLEEVLSG